MPPRRIHDDYMGGDSDSDVSILDDEPNIRKAKGKGKAIDKGKGDKGKGKAKEVCLLRSLVVLVLICPQQPYAWEASYVRSWDTVQEDETGSIRGAVEDLIARGRRRR